MRSSTLLNQSLLSLSRAHQLFRLDPKTGEIYWRETKGTKVAGAVAGGVDKAGYRIVRIDGKHYPAHRLVWFYVNGQWPAGQIDHINGNRTDNRIDNLRDCTPGENNQNLGYGWGTSKHLGVCRIKTGKWLAQITHEGKQIKLGRYDNEDDAAAAYIAAKHKIHSAWSPISPKTRLLLPQQAAGGPRHD